MSSRGVDKGATVLSYISSLEYRTISFSSSFRKIRFQLFSSLLKLKQNQSKWKLNKEIELTYSLLTFHCTLHFSQSSPVQSSPHYTHKYSISHQHPVNRFRIPNSKRFKLKQLKRSDKFPPYFELPESVNRIRQSNQPASQPESLKLQLDQIFSCHPASHFH